MVDKEEAVWKTYPDYPFIQANQFGEIRTVDRTITDKNGVKRHYKGHMLKQRTSWNGYMQISFGFNGKNITLRVHKVVASCFLPNPNNLPEINHKDNNPKNNSVDNLEWCTRQYNIAYREKYGVPAKEFNKIWRKPLFAVNLETLEVSRFESQSEAGRQLGVSQRHVNDVLKGRIKQAGGYWFTENESEITEEKIQEIKDSMYFLGGVFAVNLKTLEVLYFKSQKEAARRIGGNHGNIYKVLKGERKKAHGYWFCYANSEAVEKTRARFGDEVAAEVEELINEKLR